MFASSQPSGTLYIPELLSPSDDVSINLTTTKSHQQQPKSQCPLNHHPTTITTTATTAAE
jgi:hypothetical protein